MEPEGSLPCSQEPSQGPGVTFYNKLVFSGEELLAPCPTSRLEDHPLLAVHNCLFNIFTSTLLDNILMPIVTWDSWPYLLNA
jgi:hypothetical protein